VIGAASLIGLAASSYGQGQIIFNTYVTTPYYPIVYGAGTGPLQNTGADINVDAELGYFIGTSSNPSDFTLLGNSITAVSATANTPGVYANDTTGSGYITGPALQIPGYSSGPISFEILAWVASGVGSGAGGTAANSTINDLLNPLTWTESSIPAGASTPAGNFTAMSGPVILTQVPEPATLALAGLGGLASLVAFRRRKA